MPAKEKLRFKREDTKCCYCSVKFDQCLLAVSAVHVVINYHDRAAITLWFVLASRWNSRLLSRADCELTLRYDYILVTKSRSDFTDKCLFGPMWPPCPSVPTGGGGGGEEGGESGVALYSCPRCPSPAYLPQEEIPRHDSAKHREETFKCLACKVRQVNIVE